ncbi:hypothetical protein PENTCL1PPCAC_15855, partial [Pristionchus entomophagus]
MSNRSEVVDLLKGVPVVQLGLCVVISLIPLLILALRLHMIALHQNCKRISAIRIYIISFHGFTHTFSSTQVIYVFQELLFSINLVLGCRFPSKYHDSRMSLKTLLVGEFFAFLLMTNMYTTRRMKQILDSSLKVKYQMKETFEIGRVMVYCGAASLVMKVFLSLFMCWTLVFGFFDSLIAFPVAENGYLIFQTLNCAVCSSVLLLFHAGLRRKARLLLG